ncbi:MAG TPA: hypothetical protein VF228_26420 [Iamia sp.]
MPETAPAESPDPTSERRARMLAGGLVVMGVLHFAVPGAFDRIVPRVLGHPRKWTYLSGVAELASGCLTAVPRTRRTGALLATATIVAVYPANWQMALEAGLPPKDATGWGAWIRLPFQVPMIRFAYRVAQQAR